MDSQAKHSARITDRAAHGIRTGINKVLGRNDGAQGQGAKGQQEPAPQRSDSGPPKTEKQRTSGPPSRPSDIGKSIGDRPAPRRKLPGEMSKERPSASTPRQSTAPAGPEVKKHPSGRVDIAYEKTERHHLDAMADDQLVKHWKKTYTDPTTQRKGKGGVDIEDSRVKDAMEELGKRKIDPFRTTGPDSKNNKFDKNGKMDNDFYQPNRDPKTNYIKKANDPGSGGKMEKATGKGRPPREDFGPPPGSNKGK